MRKLLCLIIGCCGSLYGYSQAGIGTTTPKSYLDVSGSMSIVVRTFSATTTAAVGDATLIFTGTSAATLNLPDASICTGRIYWIKNAGSTTSVPTLTILPAGSGTIEGGPWWLLDEPMQTVRIASDGSNWKVYAQDVPVFKTSTAGGAWREGGNSLSTAKTVGTISNDDLAFLTNNTEGMRLSAAGFLGVGTSTPAGRLHFVSQNSESGDDYMLTDYGTTTQGVYLRKARGTVAAPADLQQGDLISQFRFSGHYNGQLSHNDGSGLDAYYQGNGSNNLTDLRFFTSGTEAVRFDANGHIGVGTSTFDATNPEKLKVDAGVTTSFNVISGKGSLDNYLQFNIQNNSNTANASSDVVATAANGNENAYYVDLGMNSGNYTNTSSPIIGGADNAYLYSTGNDFVIGNGSAGMSLQFFTNGYSASNEAMRINSSGNVGIGTTTPADKLVVAGNFVPASDNSYTIGGTGRRWSAIYAANGTIQTSDSRLKTDIRPLPYGLYELMKMKPVSYRWKDKTDGPTTLGLLAQQVQRLVPEVVAGDAKKEKLGLNYAEMIPVLIRAIQQQQQQLSQLKQELSDLTDHP